MFKKVLIANRGEIAMRIIRACRELGIKTVAVHSVVDAEALHVRFADEAICIGPALSAGSYLNVPNIISAAEITAADAIHPGYGFLSENAEFAKVVERCRLKFIGPTPAAMERWGDKVRAREAAAAFGLPLLPGSDVLQSAAHAEREAGRVGFPVMLKARGGGGGRGMRVVRTVQEVGRAFESATAEAMNAFKNAELYLERFVERPRHIEFQVLADGYKNAVWLGERDCSMQRRHQKIIEEAPAPEIARRLITRIGERCAEACRKIGYRGAGTFEFLYEDERFYFIEMNTRVQVEHPVTEMVTGVDIVRTQIRVAAGEKLPFTQREVQIRGHAIECRINAEDPLNDFAPSPGKIKRYRSPGGPGIRVDSGVYPGYVIPPYYDSLISKLVAHGKDRKEAIARMERALYEYIITGVNTNIIFHKAVLRNRRFRSGDINTHFIKEENIVEAVKAVAIEDYEKGMTLASALGADNRQVAAIAAAVGSYLSRQKAGEKS